jgi:hypothetical protein
MPRPYRANWPTLRLGSWVAVARPTTVRKIGSAQPSEAAAYAIPYATYPR